MQFCPKCGILLVQKKTRWCCPKCRYCSKDKVKITSTEKFGKEVKINVLHEKESNVYPIVTETCPKCGHNKAYYWSTQMRAGDEAETRFFKCVKCKHSWREYS